MRPQYRLEKIMRRRLVAIACCVLLCAATSGAQTRGAKPDPLSGTWTGELSPHPERTIAVTMQLKFDGKGAVTGTVSGLPNPADVKKGTFDPKTGGLKLELGMFQAAELLREESADCADRAAFP